MPKERIILLVSIVFAAAFARLLPHPANFTPVAALALFAGAYLPRTMAFFIPLAAMLLSDIVIGFHSTLLFVYAGLMLTMAIGMCLQDRITFLTTAGGSMVA